MQIGDWESTKELNQLYGEIRELGLESSVAELESFGFTVVPPERVGPIELADKLLHRILEVSEERSGVRPDLETGATHADIDRPTGQHLFYLLLEDRLFEEALMNRTALALITYLLGEHAVLSSMTSILKGPGKVPLVFHSDNARMPPPFPLYAQVANATWLLTDYGRDNGALCFVPGSHKLCRQPQLSEMSPLHNSQAVPVEAPRGSLVVWHGNTWHGAFPRANPGLRANLIMYFCRTYLRPQEAHREDVSRDMLDRNPERFTRLMGLHDTYGWKEEGPDYTRLNILTPNLHA